MSVEIWLEPDLDPAGLEGRRIAIVGYGNQGRAHALNLREAGSEVVVGARRDGHAWTRAREDGFAPFDIPEAAAQVDVVALLLPDEVIADVYTRSVEPVAPHGSALVFAHGFAIRFQQLRPRPDQDIVLVAPVGPGHRLRSAYEAGGGIPIIVAVHADPTGRGWPLARAYARGLGGGRAGVVPSTFADEVETDLFGEQAVIVGGVCALMESGFDTLVDAGYAPELAYFECIHQMKLLVDMVHDRGMAGMRDGISKTALFGDLTRGRRVVGDASRRAMRQILEEIRSGDFAREWLREVADGQPQLSSLTAERRQHASEAVGRRLRSLTSSE